MFFIDIFQFSVEIINIFTKLPYLESQSLVLQLLLLCLSGQLSAFGLQHRNHLILYLNLSTLGFSADCSLCLFFYLSLFLFTDVLCSHKIFLQLEIAIYFRLCQSLFIWFNDHCSFWFVQLFSITFFGILSDDQITQFTIFHRVPLQRRLQSSNQINTFLNKSNFIDQIIFDEQTLEFTVIVLDIQNLYHLFISRIVVYMSKSSKVTFKVILTSEIQQPFKVIAVPEEAPFAAVIRYVCDQFRVDQKTTSILTMDGVGINPDQSCGDVFLKYGSDLKMIPRDRVGAL